MRAQYMGSSGGVTDGGQVLSAVEADQQEFYNTIAAPNQDDEVMFIGRKVA